jgi:hypothetical protein
MIEKLSFLTSARFWQITIAAIAVYLETIGFIGQPEMILIASIMGGAAAIGTIDRFGEKAGSVDTK